MGLFNVKAMNDPRQMTLLMVMLLACVIGGLHFLYQYLPGAAYNPFPPAEEQAMVSADPTVGEKPLAQVEAERELYHTVKEQALATERDPRERRYVETSAAEIAAVYRWLKARTPEELAEQAYGRRLWSVAKLLQEPSRWRARMIHFYGQPVKLTVMDLPENPPGLRKLFRIVLYDPQTINYLCVVTPQVPENLLIQGETPGSVPYLAGDGFFLRVYTYATAEGAERMPLLITRGVCRAVEPVTPPRRLDERDDPGVAYEKMKPARTVPGLDRDFLLDKTFAPPKDGGDWKFHGSADPDEYLEMAAELRQEKSAFDHIFAYLWGLEKERVAELARNPKINYVTLMAGNEAPKWMRGNFAHFEGVAESVEVLRFPEHPSGIERIYLLTAGDTHYANVREYKWVVACPNLPASLRTGDRIAANGIFLKLYPYRSRGGHWRWAPLLVCREIEKLPPPVSPLLPRNVSPRTAYAILGALLAALFLLCVRMYRASQRDSDKLEAVRKRSLDRRLEAVRSHLQSRKPGQANAAPTDSAGDTRDGEAAPAAGGCHLETPPGSEAAGAENTAQPEDTLPPEAGENEDGKDEAT